MHRLYTPNTEFTEDAVITVNDKTQIHHLRDVLRLNIGTICGIFNDRGQCGEAELIGLTKQIAELKVLTVLEEKQSVTPKVILACAIPKKTKFEWIIEKATELGVAEIIPVLTHRTEVRLDGQRADKKRLRYETIAINAVKQCQRAILPNIHPLTPFQDVVDMFQKDDLILIPWLCGQRQSLKDVVLSANDYKRIIVCIGPEGDFTEDEVALAVRNGAVEITLGETVLKVETAALAAVSIIQSLVRNG